MSEAQAPVVLERRGAVALLTLNRPEALNAFDGALRTQLAAVLQRVAVDPEVRAVVLTGAGRAFSAGADLKAMGAGKADGGEVRRQLDQEYGAGVRAIIGMDKPVIAAVEGLVAGIGCAFVLASDLVVMADDAYFTLPFHNIALVPDGGINWLLERQVGARRAFEFAVDCTRLAAGRCQELGLANRVVAKGTAVDTALQWAARLAQRAPLALMHSKRLLRAAGGVGFADSFQAEIEAQAQCIDSADFREGVAAFLARREPRFTGR
ncbi:MAG: enoyl-CoA hydratase/isomerase family protein [Gammaproteobacteria bacterium]|nr:enoyl-CoA hydratase/isomerase family protein [Gammaproteobacteria bacterium]MDE2251237.1 enoyl-CoA hydratase/isomerase family protein [Gammaproteobacteria bacterium]